MMDLNDVTFNRRVNVMKSAAKWTFSALVLGSSVSVGAISPVNCPMNQLRPAAQSELLHKVVVFGQDTRMTVPQYLEMRRRDPARKNNLSAYDFTGTGGIDCGGGLAAGQLSGADYVITTSSHTFFDKDCKLWKNVGCSFKASGKPPEAVDMDSIRGKCAHGNGNEDWAVAVLKRPVKGVSFYKIPSTSRETLANTRVLQIAGTKSRKSEITVQDCTIRNVFSQGPVAQTHDCDTEVGTSGAGQYLDTAEGLVLTAIHIGGRKKDSSTDEYKLPDNFNASVPVKGEFLKAIKDSIGQPTARKN